ncbi:MAG: carboxypeptidase regulatory-like domain-containing protein [Candidatus Methanomethylophilaceae archaeon]|nr:carboxypeptidase regulatory-like domain-containing protein [Candidatus Methanomethylophilaceae archaeon]
MRSVMRRLSAVIIVITILALVAIPMVPDVSSDSTNASVSGYIKINNKFTEDKDLVITVYCPNESGTYDRYECNGLATGGYFHVSKIPAVTITDCFISFVVNAYSIDNWTRFIDHTADPTVSPGVACYRFTAEMGDDTFVGGKDYVISNDYESIILTSSYGDVTGRVITDSSTPVALNGATISIKDSDGSIVKRANSSSGGYFTVKDCPTGTYAISIEMTGYETYSDSVYIGKGTTTDIREVQLHPTDGWFGLDLPHTLAIIGGSIAVILILLGGIFLYLKRKGKDIIIRSGQ